MSDKSINVPKGDGINIRKEEDLTKWYWQVLTKTELIDTCDLSGFYILRPNAYEIWERIQYEMNNLFRKEVKRPLIMQFVLYVHSLILRLKRRSIEDFLLDQ